MNIKRVLFIGSLFILFICCYQIMNQRYDELSRYQYANNDNRDLILEHMDSEEINYLIERQYEPDKFIHYLGIKDFTIMKLDWYNYAKTIANMKDSELVKYVNELSEKMIYSEFQDYLNVYSIQQIHDFYYQQTDIRKALHSRDYVVLRKKQTAFDQTVCIY